MRRKQLEEDMRRMILKNMTAMNFEALQVRRSATAPALLCPPAPLNASPSPREWL